EQAGIHRALAAARSGSDHRRDHSKLSRSAACAVDWARRRLKPMTSRISDRVSDLAQRFRVQFGAAPGVFRAPGRINLIGEHTDYNEGFVFPAALALSCLAAAAPRDDGRIVVRSEDLSEQCDWYLAATDASPAHGWSDYVRGVALML